VPHDDDRGEHGQAEPVVGALFGEVESRTGCVRTAPRTCALPKNGRRKMYCWAAMPSKRRSRRPRAGRASVPHSDQHGDQSGEGRSQQDRHDPVDALSWTSGDHLPNPHRTGTRGWLRRRQRADPGERHLTQRDPTNRSTRGTRRRRRTTGSACGS
jgi:hypothetical protein